MRFLVCFLVLAAVAVVAYAQPLDQAADGQSIQDAEQQAEALLDVDAQGHENEGDREARQFYGGYGGFRGGYGGYRGGYGGYRGGYGGYRGGYGGYGGYRGGYGGYRGGFYG